MIVKFVTGNDKKAEEVKKIFDKEDFPSLSENNLVRVDLDLPEYQGEPTEIAKAKVEEAFRQVRSPVVKTIMITASKLLAKVSVPLSPFIPSKSASIYNVASVKKCQILNSLPSVD